MQAAAAQLVPWTGGATPALALKDLTGTQHTLEQYRGKVVLVNFWATWCGPCRDEMPSIDRLQTQHGDAKLVVLAVNVDEPEQRIRAFLRRTPLAFRVLVDPGMKAARAWNARILPASFLVDRAGRIRYSARGGVDWLAPSVSQAVAQLLNGG